MLLSPEEFIQARTKNIKDKHESLKKRWIADHMSNPQLDYDIIFKTDEEIHDGHKMVFSFSGKENNAGQDNKTKKSGKDYSDHAKMTPADWDQAFEKLLKLHLVRVPDDFYDDQLYFTDPKKLKQMFAKLEDENLRKIH